MLTEMETMTELAEIKSEIGTGSEGFHGSGSGSVDSSSSSSATPQPHHNFAWVSALHHAFMRSVMPSRISIELVIHCIIVTAQVRILDSHFWFLILSWILGSGWDLNWEFVHYTLLTSKWAANGIFGKCVKKVWINFSSALVSDHKSALGLFIIRDVRLRWQVQPSFITNKNIDSKSIVNSSKRKSKLFSDFITECIHWEDISIFGFCFIEIVSIRIDPDCPGDLVLRLALNTLLTTAWSVLYDLSLIIQAVRASSQ